MKLSELKTGEKGVIVKVQGHGGFRKRIIEMGFIKGQEVEVLLNAPLQDPVKYKLMGYEVSLRHQEADYIEVVSEQSRNVPLSEEGGARSENRSATDTFLQSDLTPHSTLHTQQTPPLNPEDHKDDYLQHIAMKERRTINVALVGNPNCGKTSLFNYASGAHGHVGNYSGVTVDATEAHASMFGYEFNLTDLPGTYSLSCYSPEELYVREHLTEKMPDVVINVVDASNLERNLYLTTQLVDMNIRMVCALNMYDEFERRGDQVNIGTLSRLFGIPMIPTSFKSGAGVKELFKAVIQVYEGTNKASRHLHINYGHEIENGIAHIQKYLKADEHITQHYSTRYLAIKLLEHDSQVLDYLGKHMAGENRMKDFHDLTNSRDKASTRVKEETGDDSETAIMDAKYGFINGALKEAEFKTGTKEDTYKTTHRIDGILSHKYFGFPIFFLLLFVMFETTFSLGCHRRRGQCDRVPAPDSDSLFFHLADGGLWLHGASRFHHGQADAQDGTARQVVHPTHHGLRLQRSGCDGHPHHREPTVEDHHDDDTTVHVVLGPSAHLHHDCRNILLHAESLVGDAVALCCRHHRSRRRQQVVLIAGHQGRGHPLRDGAPPLPLADAEGYLATYMGER